MQRKTLRASPSYKWYALAAVMLAAVMAPLDSSIANVALPVIGRAFHTGVDSTEWVLIAYMLTTSSTLVLFGRLGDMWGQKRVYMLGFIVFGLSSLACAFAPSFFVLVAARAVQGFGAAMLMSSTPAIITEVFPARERGRAIGLNGGAVALGLSSGPILGGLIVTSWSWRWIFIINVPISVVALAIGAFVLRPERRGNEGFDIPGALLAFTALLAIALGLSRAHVWGWTSIATLGALLYGVVGVAAFLSVERRAKAPALDLDLFKNRTFALSVLAGMLYFCALFCVIFTIPLSAQVAMGRNALQAGLLILPISALNLFLAPAAGALSDRVPARYVSTAGAACFLAGALLLAAQPAHPDLRFLIFALLVTGAGTAVFTQPNNSTIMGSAPANRRGIAAGVLATARTTGQLLGVCVAGAIYFLRASQLGPLAHSYLPAKAVFIGVAIIMLFVTAISYLRD
ncbi:MAG: MFS transporter [Candidatus Cybelea sp.]|jgi:EmrB/QacA subfamily drug resistance transporter